MGFFDWLEDILGDIIDGVGDALDWAVDTAEGVSVATGGFVGVALATVLIGQVLQETAQEELKKWEQACEDLDQEIRKQNRCISNALKQSGAQLDAKQCRIQLETVRKTEGELALALESHQKVIQAMEQAIHDATLRQNEIVSQLSNLDESSEKRDMKEEFAALEVLIQEQVLHRSELEEQSAHLSGRITRLKARAKKLAEK